MISWILDWVHTKFKESWIRRSASFLGKVLSLSHPYPHGLFSGCLKLHRRTKSSRNYELWSSWSRLILSLSLGHSGTTNQKSDWKKTDIGGNLCLSWVCNQKWSQVSCLGSIWISWMEDWMEICLKAEIRAFSEGWTFFVLEWVVQVIKLLRNL